MVASASAALLAPLQEWRERRLERLDDEDAFLAAAADRHRAGDDPREARTAPSLGSDALLLVFWPLGLPLLVLGEAIAWTYRRSQLTAAEKADAEGMLLLKDPASMLSALEKCVRLDNTVPAAGEAYGEIFYCWTGDSTSDDTDIEWSRVARLREVLGAEGMADAAARPGGAASLGGAAGDRAPALP